MATLLSFGSAAALRSAFDLSVDVVVLAIVLSITLSRQRPADRRHALIEAVVLVGVALAANLVGRLFIDHENVADALFVLVMSASIYVRKLGTTYARIGTVASFPFIVGLVTPLPAPPGTHFAFWAALVALITFAWVNGVRWLAARLGVAPLLKVEHPNRQRPKASWRKVSASTSMAIQMLVALSIAFVVGRNFYSAHWSWVVLTTYIVGAGTRGRGDVLHKGITRVLGALVSTVVGTFLSDAIAPHNNWAIVVILLLLGIGNGLRTKSYAYWAGTVTACLALLYGFYGEHGSSLLDQRLGGIFVGGVIAIAVAWFVLPVRTSEVFRRRSAETLAALQHFLKAYHQHGDIERAAIRVHTSIEPLLQIRPAVHAWRRVGRGRGFHGSTADRIDLLKDAAEQVDLLVGDPSDSQKSEALERIDRDIAQFDQQ